MRAAVPADDARLIVAMFVYPAASKSEAPCADRMLLFVVAFVIDEFICSSFFFC